MHANLTAAWSYKVHSCLAWRKTLKQSVAPHAHDSLLHQAAQRASALALPAQVRTVAPEPPPPQPELDDCALLAVAAEPQPPRAPHAPRVAASVLHDEAAQGAGASVLPAQICAP